MGRVQNKKAGLKGRIFDISRAAVDDGPGLRSVVYLKGCPLDCAWCHNPEGKNYLKEVSFNRWRCIKCGRCVKECQDGLIKRIGNVNPPKCSACGVCAVPCPSGARNLIGRDVTVDELLGEVLEDRDFFEGSGGGVTFSGGEPTFQPKFLIAAAKALKEEGVHVAVETCGYCENKVFQGLLDAVDLFVYDLKLICPSKHEQFTGKTNDKILFNLNWLLSGQAQVQIKIPLVPGVNMEVEELKGIAQWLGRSPRKPPVTILPFHRMGKIKCEQIGKEYGFSQCKPPSKSEIESAVSIMEGAGLHTNT